ncbi:MAG: hypothetical protein AAF316_15415 [Cyanobacteria bacterium P01_A01_bin.80]
MTKKSENNSAHMNPSQDIKNKHLTIKQLTQEGEQCDFVKTNAIAIPILKRKK